MRMHNCYSCHQPPGSNPARCQECAIYLDCEEDAAYASLVDEQIEVPAGSEEAA